METNNDRARALIRTIATDRHGERGQCRAEDCETCHAAVAVFLGEEIRQHRDRAKRATPTEIEAMGLSGALIDTGKPSGLHGGTSEYLDKQATRRLVHGPSIVDNNIDNGCIPPALCAACARVHAERDRAYLHVGNLLQTLRLAEKWIGVEPQGEAHKREAMVAAELVNAAIARGGQ